MKKMKQSLNPFLISEMEGKNLILFFNKRQHIQTHANQSATLNPLPHSIAHKQPRVLLACHVLFEYKSCINAEG